MARRIRVTHKRVASLEDAERAKNAEIVKLNATEIILRQKEFDKIYKALSLAKKRHLLFDFERILFKAEGIVLMREKPTMVRHNPVINYEDGDDVEVDGLNYKRITSLDFSAGVSSVREYLRELEYESRVLTNYKEILRLLNHINIGTLGQERDSIARDFFRRYEMDPKMVTASCRDVLHQVLIDHNYIVTVGA